MQDLWPKDLIKDSCNFSRTPVIILREQAALLGQKTNNLVEAEVVQNKTTRGDWAYDFVIVAPTLDYEYKLFTIAYNLNLYPVIIDVGEEIYKEIDLEYLDWKLFATSEEEFIDHLTSIFRTTKTQKVIGTLLALCQEDADGIAVVASGRQYD